jgi:hypothetical protein
MLVVELVLEPAEGSLALDSPAQPVPGTFIGYPSVKSGMSWYQTRDGSGSMTIRSSSSRLTGVCPSIPVSAVQNVISPASGLISQWCWQSVWSASAFAIPSRSRLLRSAPGQDRSPGGPRSRTGTPDQRHVRAFLVQRAPYKYADHARHAALGGP